jgi:energy-coupling factor transport system ATP-binding protein
MGYVFQSPEQQIVSSVVEDDVAFGCENLGLGREEVGRRISAALDAVGLGDMRARPTGHLSAGQQQRLAIAGILAMEPECLAFDEATAMLDPEARLSVLAIMDSLVSRGMTILHVTHDMSEAARASRIILLERGRVAYDGHPAAFFSGDLPERAGVGYPAVVEVARRLGLDPVPGEDVGALASRLRDSSSPGAGDSAYAAGYHRSGSRIEEQAPGFIPDMPAETPHEENPCFVVERASFSWMRGTIHETVALRAVEMKIQPGTMTALVGRTGSGKSSLLNLLDGLCLPSEGRVLAFGQSTSGVEQGSTAERTTGRNRIASRFDFLTRIRHARKPVADSVSQGESLPALRTRNLRLRAPLAIQKPEAALFEFHAADDVAFGPRNCGLEGKALVQRVTTWMDRSGLPYREFRDRPTRSLSGGEKRRLALAGIFAMESEALLLDEPGAALDPATRHAVLEIILGHAMRGVTLVMVTHSMEEAARADQVAVFSEGRLVACDSPGRIFGSRFDPAWGLERPVCACLAWELGLGAPDGTIPVTTEDLLAALGCVPEPRQPGSGSPATAGMTEVRSESETEYAARSSL